MVAMIDVVSYRVLSTPDLTMPAESTSAGIRVPGPQLSTTGGETWSHCPPNSSYVTTTRVSLACGPFMIVVSRSTRWSLPFGSLAYPGCSFSAPYGLTDHRCGSV